MNNTLLHGDCLELMKQIPSGSVDMILDDLPYGITVADFDIRIPFEPMWEQFKRVCKHNAAIVLFSQMPFGAELIMSNRKMFRYEWIWEKTRPTGFLNSKRMPLKVHENLLVFYRKLPTYNQQWGYGKPYRQVAFSYSKNYVAYRNGPVFIDIDNKGERYPTDIIRNKQPGCSASGSYHPQEKPVDLLEYLIRTYTNECEVVLDATMGSGSTCVAAVNTGRRYIGIEREQDFYDIAVERVREATELREQRLFNVG